MATPDHTPEGRGYDTSFGYFHHDNDYWSELVGFCSTSDKKKLNPVDLWYTNHPAHKFNGSNTVGSVTDYEEYKFEQRVLDIINQHDPTTPLFLNYDPHIVHEPLQVPEIYYNRFNFMAKTDYLHNRQTYHAMVNFLDGVIGNITKALKAKGMWENTLIALQSDNGGPSFSGSSHTANNFPLRGTKMSNWEGGVRVNGFVSGGFLTSKAPHMVGKTLNGFVHAADWYATFCALAGVSKHDDRAEAAGLPPVDGLNMWPYFAGQVEQSPRQDIFGATDMFIHGQFKVMGPTAQACWAGPQYPNNTISPVCHTESCTERPCLFNIFSDPTEHNDLSESNPEKLKEMLGRLKHANTGYFNPDRGLADPKACDQAKNNGNFWGPWLK